MQPRGAMRNSQQKVKCFGYQLLYRLLLLLLVCSPCICTGIIKKNHNYIVQIITFFEKKFKIQIVLAYTFFKPYILKICNSFSYVCVCVVDLEFNWIQTFWFLFPIIHLPQKLKKLDGHVVEIRLQLKTNLESNQIWNLRFLHSIIQLTQN